MNVLEFLNNPIPEVYYNDYVVLDFETTNKEYGSAFNPDNSVVLTVYKSYGAPEVVHGNEFNISKVIDAVENNVLVAHNAKFELKWLARAGADLTKVIVWDTMIAEYVFYGNVQVPLGLGAVARRYGLPGKEEYVDLCIKGGVCPSEIPTSFLERRCVYDVQVTEQVFLKQRQRAKEEGKLGVMLTRCLLTPVLADIEANGMVPDPDRVIPAFVQVHDEHTQVLSELRNMYPDVNWNSPKQLGELLYDRLGFAECVDRRGNCIRTPAGGRKADAGTIQQLKAKTKQQKKFIALVLQEAKLSTKLAFLSKLKDCCENEGVLHAEFNQCITKTHRLSSSGTRYKIQFQNMAREYKKLFKSRYNDWDMGEQDGAQLEFRIAGFLGKDQQVLDDLRHKVDVHSFTSSTITAAGQETSRQDAKAHTFKPLYGGSSGTKAEQAYYQAFKEKYSGVAKAQQDWIDSVLRNKKLVTCTGLEFFWPNTRMANGYVTNTTSICNYPVQSLATADIIPIALVYFWHRLKAANLKTLVVNTVHDSIIMEVHPDEKEIITEIGVDSFTHSVYNYLYAVYDIDFNIPLGIGIKYGKHWSEGEEISLQVEPTEAKCLQQQ
jgi:DNA polymerase I-like protein with 3'-5' exonuclease and polymerase domains